MEASLCKQNKAQMSWIRTHSLPTDRCQRQYLDAMTASGHHFATDAEECVRVMMVPVDDEKGHRNAQLQLERVGKLNREADQ